MRRESVAEILDKPTTPLKPVGGAGTPARIVEIPENVTVEESIIFHLFLMSQFKIFFIADGTAVLKCRIEGDPAPTFTWKRGIRELPQGGRIKYLTDGETNMVTLIVQKCRTQDDGGYTLTVQNKNGSDSAEVKLLVTSDQGGSDFRAMLKKRYPVFKIIYFTKSYIFVERPAAVKQSLNKSPMNGGNHYSLVNGLKNGMNLCPNKQPSNNLFIKWLIWIAFTHVQMRKSDGSRTKKKSSLAALNTKLLLKKLNALC